jgi:hypothetical protein
MITLDLTNTIIYFNRYLFDFNIYRFRILSKLSSRERFAYIINNLIRRSLVDIDLVYSKCFLYHLSRNSIKKASGLVRNCFINNI